jgi:hypothetical protein
VDRNTKFNHILKVTKSKKGHNSVTMTTRVMQLVLLLYPYDSL